MKGKAALLGIVLGFALTASPVHAVTIGFDEFDASAGPAFVTNQYQSSGVIFDGLGLLDMSENYWTTTGPWASLWSGPNMALIQEYSPYSGYIVATFVDPISGLPATTDSVYATFFDSEVGTNLVTMTALDLGGNVLDQIDVAAPAQTYLNLGFDLPGIHQLVLETDLDGTTFDNFTFNSPVLVNTPEPGTLGLLAAGLTSLAALGRRREA